MDVYKFVAIIENELFMKKLTQNSYNLKVVELENYSNIKKNSIFINTSSEISNMDDNSIQNLVCYIVESLSNSKVIRYFIINKICMISLSLIDTDKVKKTIKETIKNNFNLNFKEISYIQKTSNLKIYVDNVNIKMDVIKYKDTIINTLKLKDILINDISVEYCDYITDLGSTLLDIGFTLKN